MKVKVCMGSKCMLFGAMNIWEQLESLEEMREEEPWRFTDEPLEIEAIRCDGSCKETAERIVPVVFIEDEVMHRATSQMVMEKVMDQLLKETE